MTRLALVLTLALALLVPAVAGAAGEVGKYTDFRTPSGNIGCGYSDGQRYLRCDILHSSDMPPRPRSCDLDYGYAYGLKRKGRTTILCAGDTVVRQDAPVLRYGRTKRLGPFKCTSRRTGLTCSNRSHHGFFLSRADIRRF
jgi:hypothetical protein